MRLSRLAIEVPPGDRATATVSKHARQSMSLQFLLCCVISEPGSLLVNSVLSHAARSYHSDDIYPGPFPLRERMPA